MEVKDVLKMRLHSFLATLTSLGHKSDSRFMIEIEATHDETELEYLTLGRIEKAQLAIKQPKKKHGQTITGGTSNDKIMSALDKLDLHDFRMHGLYPPCSVLNTAVLNCTSVSHGPIYIGGRYTKLERHISHSPWEVGGVKLADESVEEFISPWLHNLIKSDIHKFGSSGREDSDVLMLGDGRPFYFELRNPKILNPTIEEILLCEKTINSNASGKINITELQVVSREMVKHLNDSVTIKSKSYSTLVKITPKVTGEAIDRVNAMTNLHIEQRNPSRVPRRADLIRNKYVESIDIKIATTDEISLFFEHGIPKIACSESPITLNDSEVMYLVVDMKTSSGTYIKEFVHGDEGRTTPCLYQLLDAEKADVLALNVSKIHMQWPNPEVIVDK